MHLMAAALIVSAQNGQTFDTARILIILRPSAECRYGQNASMITEHIDVEKGVLANAVFGTPERANSISPMFFAYFEAAS